MSERSEIHLGRILFGREAVAFYLVGGLAAAFYVLISSFLIDMNFGIADWQVSALVYAAFMPMVYFAHRLFSFRSDAPHRRAFSRYVVVQGMGLCVATVLSFAAFHILMLAPVVGSALVIGVTSIFNFLVLRGWAFAAPEAV